MKSSPKAYVDDMVKVYQKLSEKEKSRCLEFLLTNHPMELLHSYTKEWKAKLEELELGCDAPDEDSDDDVKGDESQIVDWIEESEGSDDKEEEKEVIDLREEDDEMIDLTEVEEETNPEETPEYRDELWKKAIRSSEEMELLV